MAENAIRWDEIISHLREGIEGILCAFEQHSADQNTENAHFLRELIKEFQNSAVFLDQIREWTGKLPVERIRGSILSLLKKMDSDLIGAVRGNKLSPRIYGASIDLPTAPFLQQTIISIGPEIMVSADQMKLRITIEPDFASLWTLETIQSGLIRQGVLGTLSEKGILDALRHPGKSVPVAFGQPPIAGHDAILEDVLGLDLDGIPSPIDNNRVDLKTLNWVHNITKNQVLIKKIPATAGTPGMDVFGQELPCQDGLDIPLPIVANTYFSSDGLCLLSSVDGCAYKEKGILHVVPTLDIKENVDYSTGNITADVTVNIEGDVLSGFRVESNNDIHVKGIVEASRLIAKGSIFLPGGIQGKSEAFIQSAKHIEVKFINAAQVIAHGEIIVHGSIIQSKLHAHRIEGIDQEAEIIGGSLEVAEDICADTIGSSMGVKTVIRVGHDIPVIQQKLEKLTDQINQLEEKSHQYNDNLIKISHIKEQTGLLTSTQEKLRLKSEESLKKIEEALEVRFRQKELFEESLQKSHTLRRMVRARKTILPGVEIHFMDHCFAPKEPTGPITIFLTEQGIEHIPFQNRVFESEDEDNE